MPHKRNPVLSVLVRRAALAAPALASTLHIAVGRSPATSGPTALGTPSGRRCTPWAAAPWSPASQTTELLQGLHVDADRMRATLDHSADDVLAERRAIADLLDEKADPDPTTYLGITEDLVAGAVDRARIFLEENA